MKLIVLEKAQFIVMTQTSIFQQNGHEIRSEGECKVCTCEDSGEMSCGDMICPELNCEEDELVSYREDVCCPYCLSDWVEVCYRLCFF